MRCSSFQKLSLIDRAQDKTPAVLGQALGPCHIAPFSDRNSHHCHQDSLMLAQDPKDRACLLFMAPHRRCGRIIGPSAEIPAGPMPIMCNSALIACAFWSQEELERTDTGRGHSPCSYEGVVLSVD